MIRRLHRSQTRSNRFLTVDESECAEAGEGGEVQLHGVEGPGELHDGVHPLAEALLALVAVEDDAAAEHELLRVRLHPGR